MGILMLGNEGIALGAYEAGVKLISSYPGTPSTEITEYASKYKGIYTEWAPNEKVALEVAIGAAYSGVRAMSCMKHVGLNVAADPLFSVAYTGVNAGLVIVVADDPGMHSSQNEQDSRYYAASSHVPMLEPSDSMEAKEYVKHAFTISEKYDTPVLIRLTTRVAHGRSEIELGNIVNPRNRNYKKNLSKYLMVPNNAKGRRNFVLERERELLSDLNSFSLNKVVLRDKKVGIVCSGMVFNYVMEATNFSVYKLGIVYPVDYVGIKAFAKEVEELLVIEELEPFFEKELKFRGVACKGEEVFFKPGEYSVSHIKKRLFNEEKNITKDLVPNRPPVLCPGCPHRSIFYALKKLNLIVSGDIGCYALAAAKPLYSMDLCVCMGASIGMAHGYEKGGNTRHDSIISVIGDSTFMHSGITPLINSVYNKGKTTTIILDNSTTAMTGQQENPSTGKTLNHSETIKIDLAKLVNACGVEAVVEVDAFNIDAVYQSVKEAIAKPEVAVIIAKGECALLTKNNLRKPYLISNNCVNCKKCLSIGCPAIENVNNLVKINRDLCNGCGVCPQLCPFNAILKE